MGDIDRISNLPDPILILILSLLTTKEAVQTCLLAKRYRNLWASVPVLDFNFDDFVPSDEEEDEEEEDLEEYEEKFKRFINGVFEHREPSNLDSFKLVWNDEDSDPLAAINWLDIVSKLRPKFISIHIFTENYNFQVPDSVFTCESLQELVLHLGFEAITPVNVHLPNLKRLTLDSIVIVDEVMQRILSGLPGLEEMVLCYCQFNFFEISSESLKRLVLDCYYNEKAPPEIVISTPSLVYLEVRSWAMGRIKFKNLESLVKAHIHFQEFADEDPEFLTGFSNVTDLEFVISDWDLMRMKRVLDKETTKFPTFNNLKRLKIGEWWMTYDVDLVARFVLHAPNLEKLTLLHCTSHIGGSGIEINLGLGDTGIVDIHCQENGVPVSQVVENIRKHLKTIREINTISS